MMKITSREWERLANDFKSITDGQRSMLMYDAECGTCSVPVEIDDENGLEYSEYLFEACGIPFRVHAYTLEDAMKYAVQDGHALSLIQNMRRGRSLCDPE